MTSQGGIIELRLRDVNQLFNSMDPAPFHEKDLDHDAEEFIESWAEEFPSQQPLLLRIHLENRPETDPSDTIRRAVHNYFAYKERLCRTDFRRLMRQGRASLAAGIVFLAACLVAGSAVRPDASFPWAGFLSESLTIAGWVAMWKPIQIYLYDWWPIRHKERICRRLGAMPVEVVFQDGK